MGGHCCPRQFALIGGPGGACGAELGSLVVTDGWAVRVECRRHAPSLSGGSRGKGKGAFWADERGKERAGCSVRRGP